MLPSRTIACAAVMLLLLSQTSCVYSVNPLTDPEKCNIDERLIGVWKEAGKDDVSYVFIGRPWDVKGRPDGLMVMHSTTFNADHELNWIETPSYFFSVKVGEGQYLQCVKLSSSKKLTEWDGAGKRLYQFWKYQIVADRLTLWMMDQDAAKKAIEDGVLKGTVQKKKTNITPEVTLTEPTEGLRRYLASDRSKALFPEQTKITLQRVK